jgi:hypothetical protein
MATPPPLDLLRSQLVMPDTDPGQQISLHPSLSRPSSPLASPCPHRRESSMRPRQLFPTVTSFTPERRRPTCRCTHLLLHPPLWSPPPVVAMSSPPSATASPSTLGSPHLFAESMMSAHLFAQSMMFAHPTSACEDAAVQSDGGGTGYWEGARTGGGGAKS